VKIIGVGSRWAGAIIAMESNIMEKTPRVIEIVWGTDDVKHLCPSLTDDEAWEVLQQAEWQHNCEIGLNWDVLAMHIEMLFPDRPIDGAHFGFENSPQVLRPKDR
jgi:hypothetical protein